ncbi:MAG: lysophospholipid acyltransferase family protein [Deltaproteobacteria bacterium]|nr:lysophospholipid acyltransferase family protein [Deltaproteobacteria bacterium]
MEMGVRQMRIKLSSFLQWKGNVYLYRKFGWEIAFRYLVILAAFYFLVNRKEKQKIAEAIEATFGDRKSETEMKTITKGVFDGIFAHYYEKLYNAYENNEGLAAFFGESIEADSLHKLDTALEKGKGILFVTGHYGGIEYIPIFIAMKGYPISVVAKFATPQLKETLYNKTKDLGLQIIDADQEKSVMGAIIRELRANRIVFFECDEIEEWRPSRKERMMFLKKVIGVDRTINLIQRRSGAEVVLGILHRFSLKRYRLSLKSSQDLTADLQGESSSITEALLKSLEQHIYAHPEEWYQWKNYPEIESLQPVDSRKEKPAFVPLLSPAFAEAY